ncbi:MAG: DUF3581 family protein [Candidatus Sedimenticola sp. (ex Thyasira tokunagai)]
MLLDNYFTELNDNIRFSRDQASRFAKEVAEDFNPLHNTDAKLFCVPGDLLFSVVLAKYGLSQHMRFIFSGMVGDGVELKPPQSNAGSFSLSDGEKSYLEVEHSGELSEDKQLVRDLTCSYVKFSGHSFPDLLVTLMADNNVMINPARPLVIYESMAIDLDRLDISEPTLEFSGSELTVNGKRGNASLKFTIIADGEVVGRGEKLMALRGLRPYDAEQVQQIVDDYNRQKAVYLEAVN